MAVFGDLMQITDHLNFSGLNPLIGEPTDKRFVALAGTYDPAIARALQTAASSVGVPMHKGVYTCFSGPSFEISAEIRATQVLGGDAVGMSTVPEVILAAFQAAVSVAAAKAHFVRDLILEPLVSAGAGMNDRSYRYAAA